jgi:hypothetical protein
MTTNRNKVDSEEKSPRRLGFVKFLFIAILAVTVLLLARTMVRHHFFSAGQLNRNATTEP